MKKLLYNLLIISTILGYYIHLPGAKGIYLFHVIFSLYIMRLVLKTLKRGSIGLNTKGLRNYYLFFLVWSIHIFVSIIWIESLEYYLQYLVIYYLMFILMFITVAENSTLSELRSSVNILSKMYLLTIFIGVLEFSTSFRLPGSPYTRDYSGIFGQHVINYIQTVPTAFFHNPNNFGTFITLGVAFLVSYLFYSNRTIVRLKYMILIVVSIIVLIFTDSRANYFAVILIFLSMILIYLFKNNVIKNIKLSYKLLLMGVLAIALIFVLSRSSFNLPQQVDQMVGIFEWALSLDFTEGGGSITARTTIALDIIRLIAEKPFGVGTGNVQFYLETYGTHSRIINPHNWWLELVADFGIFFLVIYVFFYISLIKQLFLYVIRKNNNDYDLQKIALGCLLAQISFIIGSVSPSSVVYFMPYWVLNGLSLATISAIRRGSKEVKGD